MVITGGSLSVCLTVALLVVHVYRTGGRFWRAYLLWRSVPVI